MTGKASSLFLNDVTEQNREVDSFEMVWMWDQKNVREQKNRAEAK